MAEFGSFLDVKSLAKLLNDPNEQSDSDTEDKNPQSKLGPGNICSQAKGSKKVDQKANENSSKKCTEENENSTKDIWSSHEFSQCSGDSSNKCHEDPRKTPIYDMHYKQSVRTEDIFLQMGNKTPGTASCENLVVVINLPNEDFHKVQLNLKPQAIDLRSPIYFLYLGLPHPIDTKAGNAKWEQDTEKLTITLKLKRDLDALNF